MSTKKIFKIVDNNFYTSGYCKQLCANISNQIVEIQDNMIAQEYCLLRDAGLLKLVCRAICEGKVEVDFEELKSRTTTKEISKMIEEFRMVAKLSDKYQKNKEEYIEI